jgi:hypothetical protein
VFHGVPAKHRDRARCDSLRFRRTWVFLTNHAHVLLCIAQDPRSPALDIAGRLGITERATQRILADPIADGYVTRTKVGRRKHYEIDRRRRASPSRPARALDRAAPGRAAERRAAEARQRP